MKKYKTFVKSLESMLESNDYNDHYIKKAGWGNGYVIIPITHPFAGTKRYKEGIEGCETITYSKPTESKIHWDEVKESDKGMWLLGFHIGEKFIDGIEVDKAFVEQATIKLRDALMKIEN